MTLISLIFLIFAHFQSGKCAGPDYFQQGVDYDIKVDLDPGTAKLAGIETITYRNNSPDTLEEIYFHLYYNAFQPGSYLDLEDRKSGYFDIANVSKRRMGYVNIDAIKIDDREITDFTVDNTIMKVPLVDPLGPGGTAVIYIEFTSQIPARGSRTAHAGRHFDVGQWYPKPAVYDRHGWHNYQYVDYEFYADFADFRVELTIPSNYIVAYMGELLNEEEIYGSKLPVPEGDTILTDVLSEIEMKSDNHADTTAPEEETTEIDSISTDFESDLEDSEEGYETSGPDTVSSEAETKTWRFEARNVHDFAFCADPGFILDLCKYKDVTIKAYYNGSDKKAWQRDAARYTRRAIKYFSEKYIPYPYGQYSTVASLTTGGMEYPQLTMVWGRYGARGSQYHSFDSVIAHEVAHAWLYGILGFNENEQAFLDEGLTSFSEVAYMEEFYGRRNNNFSYKHGWQRRLLPNGDSRNDEQKIYLRRAIRKDEDPMLTPSDRFKDGGRYYNAVYEKAASVYLMLQYVMGEKNFDLFMKKIFERWAFKHPYLADIQEIAEEIHGADLDWFFYQWFGTTWRLDYALDSVKSKKTIKDGIPGYNTTFTIKNNGRCISPLDIVLYYNKDISDTLNISHTVWMDGQSSYDTTMFLRAKPKKAIINPDRRISDINMLDNSTGFPRIQWQFMVPKFIYEDNYIEHYVESYTIAHRPLIWYNSVDGIKPGYGFDGSYLGVTRNVELEGWIGLNNGKPDYAAGYNNLLTAIDPEMYFYIKSREMEGRGEQKSGVMFPWGDCAVDMFFRRYYVFDSRYIYGDNRSEGEIFSFESSLKGQKSYRYSELEYGLSAMTSIEGSDYDFSRISGEFQYELLDILGNNTRLKLRAGLGRGNVPVERKFYLSSADPMEIWESPLYRSRGTLPDAWKDDGRLLMPGGGGLYGYYELGLSGDRILWAKLERDLPSIKFPLNIPVFTSQLRQVSPQMYIASGLVWNTSDDFEPRNFIHEAGLTFSYRIPYLGNVIDESRIWLYLPIWLSDPFENNDKFDFRWLVSFTS